MKRKIIFILESTFNKRDYHRYGFRILSDNGFKVIALDLTPLLNKKFFKEYSPPNPINYEDHYLIYTKKEAWKFISQLSKRDIVICILGINKKNFFVFDLLDKSGIKHGFLFLGLQPKKEFSLTEKIIRLIRDPNKFFQKYKFICNDNIDNNISPFDFIICGGKKILNGGHQLISLNTKIIKAHSFDYDRYLEEELNRKSSPIIQNDYVVFLDSFIPFHPDYILANLEPYCTPEKYYYGLNEFFKFIENEFKYEVIIAAHPSAKYSENFNPYENRKIIADSTPNLVKFSKFVLAHNSSSINYAVLYKKSIIFLSAKYYTQKFQIKIKTIANCFDKNPILLPSYNYSIVSNFMKINLERYRNYKEDYIKESGTPKNNIWEIFIDYYNKKDSF